MKLKIRIASRKSKLALCQVEILKSYFDFGIETEILEVITSGDQILNKSLSEIGGKGLFIKELEKSILDGSADIAVHSMKDMEAHFAPFTEIGAVLAREDRCDALVGAYQSLDELPHAARVGTASVRRAAILLHHRPDLQIKLIRGNINRRLSLLEMGEFDAIILAMAGIKRLGLDVAHSPIDQAIMPSAVAQGALAAQIRTPFDERSVAVKNVVSELSCFQSLTEVTAERALLAYLDGSCQTPIAASARLNGNHLLKLDGMILSKDGQAAHRFEMEAPAGDAEALGKAVGVKLLEMAGGRDFLA